MDDKINNISNKIIKSVRVNRYQFWSLKITTPPIYDMLLLGSSRVLRSLDPEIISQYFPGRKIYNYSFFACSLDREYLKYSRRVLHPDRVKDSHLVFGVSNYTLIPRKNLENGFYYSLEKGSKNRSMLLLRIAWQNIARLRPWSKEETLPYWLPFNNALDHYYLNGYVYTKLIKWDIMECVRWSEVIYQKVKICHELIENFLAAVKQYTKEGITVWGFRPPTCDAMRALEDGLEGFSYPWFIERFEKAGGRWLEVSEGDYCAFDGSHLDGRQAEMFSHQFSAQLKSAMSQI